MGNVSMKPKFIKKVFIRAQSADPSPPLGTVLGNLGVNTVSFCTTFNLATKTIPTYFLLKVTINIFENKTTSFLVNLPSTGYFLGLLKIDVTRKVRIADKIQDKIVSCIKINEVAKLAKFKFPFLSLKLAIFIIFGSVKAMNLTLIK